MITNMNKDQFGRLSFAMGGKTFVIRVTPFNRDRFFAFLKESTSKPGETFDHWTDRAKREHADHSAYLEIALNDKPDEVKATKADIENNMDLNQIMALSNYFMTMINGVGLDPKVIPLAASAM